MQTKSNTSRGFWGRIFSTPTAPTPYEAIFSEAKEEGYNFCVFQGNHDYVVPAENVEIFLDKLEISTAETTYTIPYSRLTELQPRPKTRTINLILREELTTRAWVFLLSPFILPALICTLSTQIESFIAREPGWAVLIIGFVAAGLAYAYMLASADNIQRKWQETRLRAVSASRAPTVIHKLEQSADDEKKYFSALINNNVDNIARYYSLIEEQANKSYRLTKNGAVAGFLLLAAGIILSFRTGINQPATALTVASGILIEFISAIFFYLYNSTIKELNKYHDKLIKVQNTMLALRVVQLIDKDDSKKNDTLQHLTLALLAKDTLTNENNGSSDTAQVQTEQ